MIDFTGAAFKLESQKRHGRFPLFTAFISLNDFGIIDSFSSIRAYEADFAFEIFLEFTPRGLRVHSAARSSPADSQYARHLTV